MEQLTEQLRRHCSSWEKLEQGEEGGEGGGGDVGQRVKPEMLNGKVSHK